MILRRVFLAAFALLIGALVWFLWPRHDEEADAPAPAAARSQISNFKSQILPPPPEPRSTLADTLNAPAGDIRADLRVVMNLLEAFRTNFPRDGSPVGDNAEITAALAGRNRLNLALLPPDHPAISPSGELCDRWGTPFFFHAESGTRMLIRSAGPDKKLYTPDDEVLSP
jgi:hypothetical protein